VLSAISRGGVEVSAAVEPPICVFAARAARAGALRKIERRPRGDQAGTARSRGDLSRGRAPSARLF
jgi:hypothetical protein